MALQTYKWFISDDSEHNNVGKEACKEKEERRNLQSHTWCCRFLMLQLLIAWLIYHDWSPVEKIKTPEWEGQHQIRCFVENLFGEINWLLHWCKYLESKFIILYFSLLFRRTVNLWPSLRTLSALEQVLFSSCLLQLQHLVSSRKDSYSYKGLITVLLRTFRAVKMFQSLHQICVSIHPCLWAMGSPEVKLHDLHAPTLFLLQLFLRNSQ